MLKVGLIDYINTLPLVGKLIEELPKDVAITLDTPAKLSKLLKEGHLDLSMISSSEFIENKLEYKMIETFGIAAKGKVKSVHLYTKLPLSYIDTIYITNHSKASYNLCRVLCALHWNIEPNFVVLEDFDELISKNAFLLIGDTALMRPYFEGYYTIDLAQQWYEMTRMPFVFGVIAYRKETNENKVQNFIHHLTDSYEWGLKQRDQIIEMARKQVPIQEYRIEEYYKHVYNKLNQKDLEALELFEELLDKTKQTIKI